MSTQQSQWTEGLRIVDSSVAFEVPKSYMTIAWDLAQVKGNYSHQLTQLFLSTKAACLVCYYCHNITLALFGEKDIPI